MGVSPVFRIALLVTMETMFSNNKFISEEIFFCISLVQLNPYEIVLGCNVDLR